MRPRATVLSSLIYLVVSITLCTIPLFNYLGYEFSAVIALLVPIIAGLTTLSNLKPRTSNLLLAPLWQSLTTNLLLLLIPLLVVTLNVFRVKNCSYGEGVLFYLLLPCVTVFFSVALGLFCGVIFRRAKLLYVLLVVLILSHPLYIGYTTPAIYSYNFIYGYFPGFSYDEVAGISPTLLLFRGVTITAGIFLFLLAKFVSERSERTDGILHKLLTLTEVFRLRLSSVILISLFMLLVGVWLFRTDLGFESSSSQIQTTLGASVETEHFRIFYSSSSFDDEEIHWVSLEHEFRYEQVSKVLGIRNHQKIDSYIYPDGETKQRFIGTGTTNIAKPWRNEIHLTKDSWQLTLKHELVHVLAGEFGLPILNIHYYTGVVEGLAEAIDNDFGNRTLHEYAAAIIKFGIVKHPEELLSSTQFMMTTSSLSYVMMGSFCKFLIDRYGMLRFKELYRGKSPKLVYGQTYAQLAQEWLHSLQRIDVPDEWQDHILYYFKRPSIFAKECARKIAYLNERAYAAHSKGERVGAELLFSESLGESWNTEAFSGMIRLKYEEQKFDTVISLMNEQLQDTTRRNSLLSLLLLYADAQWATGKDDTAMSIYKKLTSFDLSERFNEAVELRMAALGDTSVRLRLTTFFTASLSDSESVQLLDSIGKNIAHPLLQYLNARLALRQKNFREVVKISEKISMNSQLLLFGKERMLGETYFRLKDFQQAKVHFWQSLNYTSNKSSVQRIEDWIERCEWFEQHGT
jgi:hypothetical protein